MSEESVQAVPPVDDGVQAPRTADLSGTISAGSGNVDKIRDILFGTQMKDYERRFSRLEERILKEIGEARDDTRRRFESFESYMKQELATLTERLQTEQNERNQAVKTSSRALQDVNDALELRLGQLSAQLSDSQREMRRQLLDQSNQLREESRQKTDEIATLLERSVQELRTDKTDRSALAALFTELAMRLNDEFTISTE